MEKILVTGSGGLIGSESCKFFLEKGAKVFGIDNNLRKEFFGEAGDITGNLNYLKKNFLSFENFERDIRNREEIDRFFQEFGPFDLIIHTAAQPSHDWAKKEPFVDFDVNAVGTLNLLEATRKHSTDAVFIFTSTNKVYGDNPNMIPLRELETRWEYNLNSNFPREELKQGVTEKGINENLSLDNCTHSFFGASKAAADLYVQEYGKNHGLKTGIFRGGCLTGPQHSAVELHGFLNYIVECAITGKPYTIYGYKGKQVRDQIHSKDVVEAFWQFYQNPHPGEVYNLGGCRENSASVLEIINFLKKEFNLELNYSYSDENRIGDHICYYSDMGKFKNHYPAWKITKDLREIIREIIDVKKLKLKKRVLVTGGAGFIGSNLVRSLLKEGREIVILDNLSTGKRENIPSGVEFIEGDLINISLVEKALENVDVVYHFGASASVIKSVEDPKFDVQNNVIGAINLLDVMVKKGCKRILFSSSSTIYGKNKIPMHEELMPNPVSPYATGKRTVELLLSNYAAIHGINSTCFRIFNAYGPFQDLDFSHQGITGYIIGTALKGREFSVHGNGDQERDYVFIDDITRAFMQAENNPKTFNQIINLGSGEKISLIDLIRKVENLTGKQIPLRYGEPYRKGDVMTYHADTKKFNLILGFSPSTDMNSNLEKTIKWAKSIL